MNYQVLKGTHDVILEEASSYSEIENILTMLAQAHNFKEFRIPVIEKSELFLRSVGESSDIVRKEMYTFKDKGDRDITLRPEFTAGIIRSMVNSKLYATSDMPIKAFYVGPVFRYDRPQQGRYRQFNQFGVESVGSNSYLRDVEVINYGFRALSVLGFDNVKLVINSIGDEQTRSEYREALVKYFEPFIQNMCPDCQERFKLNPLRILDCKDPEDQKIVANAPKISEFLSEESRNRFDKVLKTLDTLEIEYDFDNTLVRGLDYYSETVFEFAYTSKKGNNYGAIGAGGHYSNLVKEIGGPDLPGVGLSFGIERLYNVLHDDEKEFKIPNTELYVMPLVKDDDSLNNILSFVEVLRMQGIITEINLEGASLSSMFKKAEKCHAKAALIIGEDELENDTVQLKNLETKEQRTYALSEFFPELIKILDGGEAEEEECNCGHHHDDECHHDCDCECDDDCDCDEDHECCCGHHKA